ncbi:MAG TPA: heterodisulfide reductase-related iron-sulfur binding cluster [Longimicrobiales bacterium]|nr:heterodisulfide reductase-related iron-sulfur binding cluster [Longimicrobiales bacterium]
MQPTGGPADALRAEEAGLLACVHCGFCLNACPTYTRLGHEGDSPRGRLDLMRAVVEGRLDADDPSFRTHIDRCLGCRACEPVCPSGVPYGFLLERARAATAGAAGIPWSTRLLIATFTGPLRGVAGAAARLLRATGLPRLLARWLPARLALPRFAMAMLAASAPWPGLAAGRRTTSPGTRRRLGELGSGPPAVPPTAPPPARPAATAATLSAGAPQPVGARTADGPGGAADDVASDPERGYAAPHALEGAYPAATAASAAGAPVAVGSADHDARQKVALLEGCVQHTLFTRVNAATARVLTANGCELATAPGQRCCGALDAHAGRLKHALELARTNIAAFEAAGADVVVVNAAGCGAMMKEYGEQLRHDDEWAERAAAFSARVRDVNEFLAARSLRRGAPLPVRVTYDAPCHLLHAQRIRDAPLRLLDGIPGLERVPLPDSDECCGGAGLYGVQHPELGGRILADKVAAIRATGADVVVTPNPGCMMQIGAGLLLHGVDTAVVHPLELLDESYSREGEGT